MEKSPKETQAMDTKTKIMMRILDDLYSTGKNTLKGKYSKYYESLDRDQPKIVVSDAIKQILSESKEAHCDFNETTFELSIAD